MKHPGTHILYNTDLHVKEGGGTFRARFGVERNGQTLLAEGSYSKGSEIQDGYPEFTVAVLKRLGWYDELTAAEKASIERVGGQNVDRVAWSTDLSGGIIRVAMDHGCVPYGNAKARAVAWNLPDPVPVHREPIYTPRTDLLPPRDLMAQGAGTTAPPPGTYPALPDRRGFRMPHQGQGRQLRSFEASRDFPIILTSGRLVEYKGVAFMPFHFGGWFLGEDRRRFYPPGTDPVVLGESVNAITTYGYDPVTMMQETKVTLCQIRAA